MLNSLLIKRMKLFLLLLGIFSSLIVSAQTRITGKVIGADDKQPVIGASVRIRGTTVGTVTDASGNFSITAKPADIISVSYLGYQSNDITVGSQTNLRVTLSTTNSTLNEVVVTGYTTQRKQDITGAVATVNVAAAKQLPVTSSEQLLQGQASGVTVINQGAPGSSSTVFVRGITNFGNSSPLYVIDGVQTNSMSQVNPNDIESISVLKDAGAAAIYGVAGGNGVIVVTTKRGRAGKTTLSYDAYYGVQTPLSGNVWHLMTPAQQSQLAYIAGNPADIGLYSGSGGSGTLPTYGYHGGAAPPNPAFSSAGVTNDPSIQQYYHFDAANPNNDFLVQQFNQAGTDWFHQIFKNAPQQSHTITASGGTDKSSFLYSLNYLNQQGTLIETYEKRYTARANTSFSVLGNHVRFGENGYVFYRENNGGSSYAQQQEGGTIAESFREMPLIPVYDIAGNYGGAYAGPGTEATGNGTNPFAAQQRTKNDVGRTWNIQGTVFAEADFLKHFTARTAFSGNAGNAFFNNTGYNTYENYESHNTGNSYTEGALYYFNFNYTNTLQYRQIIGKHNITAFAGYEIRESGGQQLQAFATNFFTLDPNYLTAGTTTLPTSISLNSTQIFQPTSTQSVFGRVDYTYADKYLLGATVRRDGYSSFFPGRQYGTFPSISLGWRVSQEDFLKSVNWLNNLKIRGSLGTSGSNANIGGANAVNTYGSSFGTSYYAINGGLSTLTPGFYQASIGNPKTSWETDKILNIGLDATLFNRLDLSVEYYKKSISGLLFALPLPSLVGGANAPTVNVGDVQNRGFDISATFHDAIGGDFKYSIGVIVNPYKNKITSLPGGYFDVGGSRDNLIVREQVGMPIGEFFGYKIKGIYQNAAQLASLPGYNKAAVGSYIYQDTNGDGKIDNNDRTFIGNPNPNFTYGVNLNASYKRFDFTAVLYGSHGNQDFNYTKYYTDFYSPFSGGKNIALLTQSAKVVNGVVTNPDATISAASFSQPLGSNTVSSYFVEDGSFLKCRVVSLGYTFDPGMLKTVGVDRLHLYFQVTNLFTITKYTGLDPEIVPSVNNLNQNGRQSAAFGIDYGAYPNNQRQYILGINLSF